MLYEHPTVAEAPWSACPTTSWARRSAPPSRCSEGATATPEDISDVRQGAGRRLQVPAHVWFVDELPKGPTGKILRREVHAPAEG